MEEVINHTIAVLILFCLYLNSFWPTVILNQRKSSCLLIDLIDSKIPTQKQFANLTWNDGLQKYVNGKFPFLFHQKNPLNIFNIFRLLLSIMDLKNQNLSISRTYLKFFMEIIYSFPTNDYINDYNATGAWYYNLYLIQFHYLQKVSYPKMFKRAMIWIKRCWQTIFDKTRFLDFSGKSSGPFLQWGST